MRTVGATALALGALVVGASPALASGGGNDTSAKLRKAVSVDGVRLHQGALNLIGAATGGNRLAGTRGFDLSADYVDLHSRLAGLSTRRHEFEYALDDLADYKPPVLDVRRGKHYIPGIAGSIPGGDFGSMYLSPSGDVTAPVWAGDLTLPSPAANTSTSGCEAADFVGMPQGAIVLLQRGTCTFAVKWANAQAAGAGALVQINEGDPDSTPDDDRLGPLWFDMTGSGVTVPIVAAQIATVQDMIGSVRKGPIGKTARLRVDWRPGTYATDNVIAETRGGDPNKVIVVGAHLDSVGTGPGHQRQRLRLGRPARVRALAARREDQEQDPLRLVQRRGVRAARLRGLRREPAAERALEDRRDAQLRHDRLQELRQPRLRRGPVGLAADPAGDLRP